MLPLEAMHSDMDILTRTLGLPQSIEVATVARDEDSAAVEATLAYTDGFVRDTVSSLMPMGPGAPAAAIRPPSLTACSKPPRPWVSTANQPAPSPPTQPTASTNFNYRPRTNTPQ